MIIKFIHEYKIKGSTSDRVLMIFEDEVGWLYIAKMGDTVDNIFPSIEWIETYFNTKFELVNTYEVI